MASAPAAAVAFAAIKVAQTVNSTIDNYREASVLDEINRHNAALTEESIKALNYEEAMNKTLMRLNAYSEIGSGRNMMSSRGNIGTSADSAVINAYANLAGDLEAMTFNYENKRWDLKTAKEGYLYHAKVAKAQKKNALIGGGLSTAGAIMQGVIGYNNAIGIPNKTGVAFDKMQYLSANNLLP